MVLTMSKISPIRIKTITGVAIIKDFKETLAWQVTH